MYVRLMTQIRTSSRIVGFAEQTPGRRPQMPNVRVLKFAQSAKGGPVKTGI